MKKKFIAGILLTTVVFFGTVPAYAEELSNEKEISQEERTEHVEPDSPEEFSKDEIPFENNIDESVIKYEVSEDIEEGTLIESYEDEEGRSVEIYAASEVPAKEVKEEDSLSISNEFSLIESNNKGDEPSIDNGGWSDYPLTYTYNYDNTPSATQWGMWGGNGNLQGYVAEDTEDINVSNAIGLYCDGKNVKLYVKYASCWNGCANGNDYNFNIDGQNVKYRVVFDDNTDLTDLKAPGTYGLKIMNGDGAVSGSEVYDSYGKIIVNENNLNNEMEISIPLEEFLAQNPDIDIENMQMINFSSPNITYKNITCCGAGNNQALFSIFSFLLFGGAILKGKGFFIRNVHNYI